MQEKSKALRNTFIVVIVVIVIALGVWFTMPREPSFCFNFVHDLQYGDRALAHPVNVGILGPRGTLYFIPEVPALQTALSKEGFYIDPYEATGGGVYLAAFFGPTTKSALMDFQKKYGLDNNGTVDDPTTDKLRELYGCKRDAASTIATSTVSIATTTKTVK